MKLILPLLLTACVAWAQATPEPGGTSSEVKPAETAPATAPAEQSPPAAKEPAAPPGPPTDVAPLLPSAFHDQVMSWDSEHHQALQGFARKALSRDEFFTAIHRPDLIEQSDVLARRRVILAGSAVLVGLAGIVSGWLVLSNNVDLNGMACVQTVDAFNQCSDVHSRNTLIGGVLIAAGAIGAGLFATFAYWAKPDVVDDDEAQRLISQYNGDLLKRLRLNAILVPGGGAVGVSTRF